MKKDIDSYIVEAVKDRSRKCLKLICIVLDGCCSSSTRPSWAQAVIYLHCQTRWNTCCGYIVALLYPCPPGCCPQGCALLGYRPHLRQHQVYRNSARCVSIRCQVRPHAKCGPGKYRRDRRSVLQDLLLFDDREIQNDPNLTTCQGIKGTVSPKATQVGFELCWYSSM